ncbi:MAG: PilZ domain-containing protein [Polyangiaceae bacterium]|nr:PilZ domain-containing protein [Polyangiaceae bacterium]
MEVRDHFRAAARQPVHLPAMVEVGGRARRAVVLDLGLEGASVEGGEPLAVGDRVLLSVTAPNLWDPLDVPAEVRWSVSPGPSGGVRLGLRFHPRDGRTLRALATLLATTHFE